MMKNLYDVYPKARIKHIDKAGTITPVNVISTSECVTYYNATPTVEQIGDIEPGTVFDNIPISSVLDKLLYPYVPPKFIYINSLDNEKFESSIKYDTTIYEEVGNPVKPFTMNVNFKSGSEELLTCKLITTLIADGSTIETTLNAEVQPNTIHSIQFSIPKFSKDCTFEVVVSDSKGEMKCPMITYKFVDCAYVGFCDETIFDSANSIDRTIASNYFNNAIANKNPIIQKVVGTKKSIKALNLPCMEVDMHPVLLVPLAWGYPESIIDANYLDIDNIFFEEVVGLNINDNHYDYRCIICKEAYPTETDLISGIEYRYSEEHICVKTGIFKGTPLLTGFDMLSKTPLDRRSAVKTIEDLENMKYKYEGLITYCKELGKLMLYKEDKWVPVANEMYFVSARPEEDKGSIGDTAFDLASGEIYRKDDTGWNSVGHLNVGGEGNAVQSVKVGSITTGTEFNVVNSGTSKNVVLDFTFPAMDNQGKLLAGANPDEATLEKVFLRHMN